MVLNLKITKGLNSVNHGVDFDDSCSTDDDNQASAVILRYFLIKCDKKYKSYDVFREEGSFHWNGGSNTYFLALILI